MALNLTTKRVGEIFGALLCMATLLCSGMVLGAPMGTATFTTFDPTTASKATVPCEEASGGETSSHSTPDVPTAADLRLLTTIIDTFKTDYSSVFMQFTKEKLGPATPSRPNYIDSIILQAKLFEPKVANLPDINAVNAENMTDADLITTHYFIVKGFKAAMLAVINDETENNNSRKFTQEFVKIESDLGRILRGTQDVICGRGNRGSSTVGEPQDLGFDSAGAIYRMMRDYYVMYHLNEYATKLYQDMRRLMES